MDQLPRRFREAVVDSAIEANLGFRDREQLLVDIPHKITHALTTQKNPGDQIRSDVYELLRSFPDQLRVYLENAARIADGHAIFFSNAARIVGAFARGERSLSEGGFDILLGELYQVPEEHQALVSRHLAQAVADNFDSALGDPESEQAFALMLRQGTDRRVGRSPHPALVSVLAKMAPEDRRFLALVVTHVCYHAGGKREQIICRRGTQGPPPQGGYRFQGDETLLENVQYRFHHGQLVELGLAHEGLKNGSRTIRLEQENSSAFTFQLTPTGAMLAASLVPALEGRPCTQCGEGLPYRA